MNSLKILISMFALALFIIACNQVSNTPVAKNDPSKLYQSATPAPPEPGDKVSLAVDEIALGKDLYSTNCMICHRESGKGGKVTIEGKTIKPDDLTSDSLKKHSDEKLFSHVSDGVPDEGMPAFKGKLTDDEIRSIVQHVRSLQSK